MTVRYLTSLNFYDFFCSGGAKEMALAISTLDVMIKIIVLGLRKNIFTELAPKFRLDLVAPIEQIHRNPDPIGISRILCLRRRQRWHEDGMRKCTSYFCASP
jgi:hypothetical protein